MQVHGIVHFNADGSSLLHLAPSIAQGVHVQQPAPGVHVQLQALTPPCAYELTAKIQNGSILVSPDKATLTARQIQCHFASIQRSLGLQTGIHGTWSQEADDRLQHWLSCQKKARCASVTTTMSAIADAPSVIAAAAVAADSATDLRIAAKADDTTSSSSDSDSSSDTASKQAVADVPVADADAHDDGESNAEEYVPDDEVQK